MPSSTSLLENEETESELSPLVLQTFVGIGLEDHGTQSQAEPLEPHRHTRPTSHFSLLDAVLELQPLPRHQLPAEECEEEVDERVPENTNTLLAQAPGLGSVMLPGMEGPETVILYSGGLDDSTPHQVPGMIILPSGYREAGFEVEQPSLMRRKSVNTTECVGVPSSEHVAEIVGRQGCKIKALRAKTNTYIKTPVRGEQPVFVVTGRKEDVAMAKREILSAAEHFSLIRASRNKAGSITGAGPGVPALPGQTTIQVRVPYRVVGLVVGPKGATIKRIQQQTHTYIVTPSRDKEPVFEVTGMPENVDRAREEIEAHIALRTGGSVETLPDEDDFHYNGTDVSFDAGGSGAPAQHINMATSQSGRARGSGVERTSPSYRNNSSGSLGSGSSDSYYGPGGNRMADFSPTSPFGGTTGGGFCFGENLVPLATEDLPVPESTGGVEGQPVLWAALLESGCQDSQPATPRLSPTFHAALEHGQSHPMCTQKPTPRFSSYGPGFSSSGNSSASSSPDSVSSWGPYPGRQDYVHCPEGEVIVPWHNDPFRTCQKGEPPSLVPPAPDVRLYNA